MRAEKTKAIILKKTKYSESDLILQMLSQEGENLSLIARGALKSKKRFGGGVLDPTHYVQIQYKVPLEEGRLLVLEEATLLEDFHKIRTDYARLEYALFLMSAFNKISQSAESGSQQLFHIAGNSLRAIGETANLEALKIQVALKILFQEGVLEQEAWMADFLGHSIQDRSVDKISGINLAPYARVAEMQLLHYLG